MISSRRPGGEEGLLQASAAAAGVDASTRQVTVIGAGSVGVSTALHLLQRGWQVTLIDRREAGEETSYGNAGVINPASNVPLNSPDLHTVLLRYLRNDTAALRFRPRHVLRNLTWFLEFLRSSKTRSARHTALALFDLTSRAREEHKALMQQAGNSHRLRDSDWLKVYRNAANARSSSFLASIYQACGIEPVVLDASEIHDLEPALKPIYQTGVLLPDGGFINNPGLLVKEYAAHFRERGGAWLKLDVQSIDEQGDEFVCRGAGGMHRSRHLVIAAGPWSGELLSRLHYRVALGVERGYHAHYHPAGAASLGRSVHDVDAHFIIGPMEQGVRVTTGVELAPRDAPSNPIQLEQVEPRVREAIDLGPRTEDPIWRGARPTLPDSRPMIGPVAGHSGLWVNFGHQHIGLMTGPVSGRLLAELMSGENTEIDPHPFRPSRWLNRRRSRH